MTDKIKPGPAPAASPATRAKTAAPPAFGGGRIASAAVIVLAIIATAWIAIELTRFFMLVFACLLYTSDAADE